jgi:uncharacterized protein YndB with AHSA1/START domain
MTTVPESTLRYQLFIKATAEQIWRAITTPELTRQFMHECVIDSTYERGAPYNGYSPDRAEHFVSGEVVEAKPPLHLRTTWLSLWDTALADEPPSQVIWDIEPYPDGTCLLTLVHDHLEHSPGTVKAASVAEGWLQCLCGLKTLLETGEPLSH